MNLYIKIHLIYAYAHRTRRIFLLKQLPGHKIVDFLDIDLDKHTRHNNIANNEYHWSKTNKYKIATSMVSLSVYTFVSYTCIGPQGAEHARNMGAAA